jgi:hypothetical protein
MRSKHSIIRAEGLPVYETGGTGGSRCIALLIINLDAGWEVDITATLWLLYPPGKISGTHCIGGCISPRAGLDECGDKKISCLYRGSNPEPYIP